MATVDPARRAELGRLKRARTRESMIEAALELIRERGVQKPTIDDFIEAAGVARGTFYNHFRTKEELIQAASAFVADSIDALITPLFRGSQDPGQRISIAIRQFIRVSRDRPSWGWVLVQSLPGANAGWSEEMRRGVLADIRKGQRSGRFHIPSVQSAAALGIGALAMAIRTVLVERTPADFAESIAAMTLRAMGMDPEECVRVARLPLPTAAPGG